MLVINTLHELYEDGYLVGDSILVDDSITFPKPLTIPYNLVVQGNLTCRQLEVDGRLIVSGDVDAYALVVGNSILVDRNVTGNLVKTNNFIRALGRVDVQRLYSAGGVVVEGDLRVRKHFSGAGPIKSPKIIING